MILAKHGPLHRTFIHSYPPITILPTLFSLSRFKLTHLHRSYYAFNSSNMPPKKSTVATGKRKADSSPAPSSSKKARNGSSNQYKDSSIEEEYGIVLREFYPPEMTNERAHQYNANEIQRPIEALDDAIESTNTEREKVKVKDAVVHWFKCDLRTHDNKGLHLASEKAKSKGVPLIGLYIVSPQDFSAHLTSAVRVDFILRTLEVLKADLAKLDIPLYVETVQKRKAVPSRVIELCEEWGASHVYADIEYEVDELRREAALTRNCLEKGIAFNAVPDTCVVSPGELSSQSGNQFAVYTPWYRAWVRYLNERPQDLDAFAEPSKNPREVRKTFKRLFDATIPEAPENKQLSVEEKKRFKSMWPPGEHEANERLEKFVKQKIRGYADARNIPSGNGTSVISVHFASGTLATRTAVRTAMDANSTKKLDGGNPGIMSWISEVAWRDFYKHVMAHWPFVW